MKCLAIVTARGGSKRIPRKNVRQFCGKPIILYTIEAALKSNCFDRVMVSTDDTEIARVSALAGAQIPFMRSERNSNDDASTVDVLVEVLDEYRKIGYEPEIVCCLYPTAPFITASLLRNGFDRFVRDKLLDSAFPIVKFSYPIQRAIRMRGNLLSMISPENSATRSQDLEATYHDAGQFYWLRIRSFLKERSLIMSKTEGILLPESQVQDIDTEEDWMLAEMKYKNSQTICSL